MSSKKNNKIKPLLGLRVASLVTNSCAPDPRVIKQAESLVGAGAEVTIFCMAGDGLAKREVLNGVKYDRLDPPHTSISYLSGHLLRFSLNSFIDKPIRSVLLLLASLAFASLRFLNKLFKLIMNILGRDGEALRPDFVYGRKSLVRAITYAFYVFLRGDTYRFIFSQPLMDYKPDVIHAHDFITVPAAVHAAKYTHAKVIFDAHEIEADRIGSNNKLSIYIIKKDLQNYLRNIDGIISVNESAYDYYNYNYGLYGLPKEIIYNSPVIKADNSDQQTEQIENLRSKLKIADGDILFIYTGSIGIDRGVPEIVEAMAPVNNAHLCIMGPQRDSILTPFNKLVDTLNMKDRVHILPPVPHYAVTQTIKTADAGIMFTLPTCLNHIYCLPNKIFESSMAGLPVVGPDLPEIKKFIESEKIGLVAKAGDVKMLTKAIVEMTQDPLRFRPNDKKLNALQEKWSWPAQGKKLISFYERLLEKNVTND